jgi:hypothetical protein
MASAAPVPNLTFAERFRKWFGHVPALLLTLLACGLTYFLTVKANDHSALQQQYLGALQQFDQTGSAMDVSVTSLADAVREERGVADAKRNALNAIAVHAGASQALNEIVGRENMNAYQRGVGRLTDLVEATADLHSAVQASQARFDVMHNRNLIRDEARRNIYGDDAP